MLKLEHLVTRVGEFISSVSLPEIPLQDQVAEKVEYPKKSDLKETVSLSDPKFDLKTVPQEHRESFEKLMKDLDSVESLITQSQQSLVNRDKYRAQSYAFEASEKMRETVEGYKAMSSSFRIWMGINYRPYWSDSVVEIYERPYKDQRRSYDRAMIAFRKDRKELFDGKSRQFLFLETLVARKLREVAQNTPKVDVKSLVSNIESFVDAPDPVVNVIRLQEALKASYLGDNSAEIRELIKSRKVLSKVFDAFLEIHADGSYPLDMDKMRRSSKLIEFCELILKHQGKDLVDEIVGQEIIGKVSKLYQRESKWRRELFIIARKGPSSHAVGYRLNEPEQHFMNWANAKKIDQLVAEGKYFPEIPKSIELKLPDKMQLYNAGIFVLNDCVVSLSRIDSKAMLDEIDKTKLIRSVFSYSTLPSFSHGYVSGTSSAAAALVSVVESNKKFYRQQLSYDDPVLGMTPLEYIELNKGKGKDCPFMKINYNMRGRNYGEIFTKLAKLLETN